LAWLAGQSKQRSVGWVGGECAHRDRIRHVETSWRITAGRGFPA
jgi:hypothetical protein